MQNFSIWKKAYITNADSYIDPETIKVKSIFENFYVVSTTHNIDGVTLILQN